ncbi:MAG: IS4 family transposase [Planctomycetota bacterium]
MAASFSRTEVEQLARSCGFVQRTSPITGFHFLLAFTTGQFNSPGATLAQIAAFLSSVCGIEVSTQAVDGRIQVAAMAFMRLCLEMAMAMATRPRASDRGALAGFDHVYIIDSTTFDINPSFQDVFKGSGGSGSAASMRIQLVLDYLTGRLYVECGDTKLCDAPTLCRLVENHTLDVSGTCLFLADLGYFKFATFSAMSQQGLHLISKLAFKVTLLDPTGTTLDLNEILKGNPDSLDLAVTMNGQPYRLVARKLPESIVNRRLRKANKTAKDNHGRSITDDYRRFLGYAIFLTDLPPAYNMDILFTIYRIRWQIELVFKTWKSILGIHKIRSARLERLMCEIYGKLIVAALSSMITAAAENASDMTVVSLHRAMKHLQTVCEPWSRAILQGGQALSMFIDQQTRRIARLCKKHRQKNKPTIEALIYAQSPAMQNQPLATSTTHASLA